MEFYFNYNSAQITSDFLFSNENTIAEGFRVSVLYTPQKAKKKKKKKYDLKVWFKKLLDIFFGT